MKIFFIILGSLVTILIAIFAWLGGFKQITVSTAVQGGETFFYKAVNGDYKQAGTVMDEVYALLKEKYDINTFKGCGLYYDNPEKVEVSKLRSEMGCIIENPDREKITEAPEGYAIKTLETKMYVVTEFPFKGMLSVFVSLMKVYPALNKYASDNNIKGNGYIMEMYDIPNGKILYRMEMDK